MASTSTKRGSFFGGLLKFLFYIILIVSFAFGGYYIGLNEDGKLYFRENVKITISNFWEDTKNFFNNSGDKDIANEKIEFEGAKLSEVTSLNMNDYVDFTIPYTWTFGKIEVDDAATEEAIAITGDNVVMTISLRNVEIQSGLDNIKWTKDAMMYELEETYPDYIFNKANMFEDKAAIIEGTTETAIEKLYLATIPVKDKTIFVCYSFLSEDWNAELYFTTTISEMLETQ